MPTTPATEAFGTAGWLGILAFAIGGLIRLLKADKLNTIIAKWGLPPIPKVALPWLALLLGAGASAVESASSGQPWKLVLIAAGWGIFSGAGAVLGNEALSTPTRAVSPAAADVIFGKNAGPGPDPTQKKIAEAVAADIVEQSKKSDDLPNPPPPPVGPTSTLLMVVVLAFALPQQSCTPAAAAQVIAAVPSVIQAVQEAALILDQIDAFADHYFAFLPGTKKEMPVRAALGKARAALVVVQHAGEGTQEAVDATKRFQESFDDLMSLVQPIGVKLGSEAFNASPAEGELSVTVTEPLLVKKARGK